MAWASAALVLAITSLSAFLRLSAAGLGCEPWPQCYGEAWRLAGEGLSGVARDGLVVARIAHRLLAVAALLLIIAMLMSTYSKQPVLRREGRMVLGLLALALFLAILGRWTAGARVPAVTLGNLLGGFALFALSCRLAWTLSQRSASAPSPRWLARWTWIGGALLVLQVLLGGLVSAGHAGLSCPQLAGCETAAGSWQLLNPWYEPSFDRADPTHPAGALVHALHRAGAWVLAAVLLPLGIVAWRKGRRAGAWLLALLMLQAGAGAALVLGGLPLAVALVHNILAALLLAAMLALAR
jgi:heme a synthase